MLKEKLKDFLPSHLNRYVVDQDYSRYTPVNQAVWRHIMRRLKSFLSEHAHDCYVEGLAKTGISVEFIPSIEEMDKHLNAFNWRAVPVSGFIPPAAFMELQSLGVLPIASDMRTLDHLLYTPAPDIVHEAAGHAPILIDPKFASYLKKYAKIAKKAIISREDLNLYEAIRNLSDIKEAPESTPSQIEEAEKKLLEVSQSMSHVSEATLLGRMNWWTAEYGLIGSLENPKIFGAGLLSSVGESRDSLKSQVKKVPLTVDCINYTYDITEPQPQLFVTPDFETLETVLEELGDKLSFRIGGLHGVEVAKKAETVNTVQLNSGLQISGMLSDYKVKDKNGRSDVIYLQFSGPTQLCSGDAEMPGHNKEFHNEGYGTPVGFLKDQNKCLSTFSPNQLQNIGVEGGLEAHLVFDSGVEVKGRVKSTTYREELLCLITFEECTVTYESQVLFQPEWGVFDMAVGSSISSVYGGAADQEAYGTADDFVIQKVPTKEYSEEDQKIHALYQRVRQLREGPLAREEQLRELKEILDKLNMSAPKDWLLRVELLELSYVLGKAPWHDELVQQLEKLKKESARIEELIQEGMKLAPQI